MEMMSYGELQKAGGVLARRLVEAGCRVDELVALMAERSLDMVVGIVGILAAGCGYVPVSQMQPKARLAEHAITI